MNSRSRRAAAARSSISRRRLSSLSKHASAPPCRASRAPRVSAGPAGSHACAAKGMDSIRSVPPCRAWRRPLTAVGSGRGSSRTCSRAAEPSRAARRGGRGGGGAPSEVSRRGGLCTCGGRRWGKKKKQHHNTANPDLPQTEKRAAFVCPRRPPGPCCGAAADPSAAAPPSAACGGGGEEGSPGTPRRAGEEKRARAEGLRGGSGARGCGWREGAKEGGVAAGKPGWTRPLLWGKERGLLPGVNAECSLSAREAVSEPPYAVIARDRCG